MTESYRESVKKSWNRAWKIDLWSDMSETSNDFTTNTALYKQRTSLQYFISPFTTHFIAVTKMLYLSLWNRLLSMLNHLYNAVRVTLCWQTHQKWGDWIRYWKSVRVSRRSLNKLSVYLFLSLFDKSLTLWTMRKG